MRHLNWPAIFFGAGAGLAASLLLFALSFGLGTNIVALLIIQSFGFFIAGFVSGRYALSEPMLSGGVASLVLWVAIVLLTITDFSLIGSLALGIGAMVLGPYGGAVGYNRRKV